MSPTIGHPEWLAIGAKVVVVRRIGRSVAWRHEGVVVRHTKTSVVVSYSPGTEERFVSKWGEYVLTPKYLDYTTTVEVPRG